ncbi:thioredoxin family protein [Roseinatronobacter bogoriensis]|uniref:Thioredoxin n=1 Tax=Roseinatronobacter bogoriensis subsp. barguzinensis TaxID=441209 RepID=A0A2K8KBI9_9RHOB|nr:MULTISPECIES: thioredoxin family protein [Rhodobaca]ATX65273.1 thioredoxin [Rhodobaca barguzinensis]MBB4209383.1 thioredoxin-related protein [Rhodobaca bogoriensis DSM 18756]TDW34556.1 thioredoxin-related protein [Rhodobaca barguzinensis]TDY67125.1 thioredoxin-related protein [Rhodobaca bogoriensis DSM 18756]
MGIRKLIGTALVGLLLAVTAQATPVGEDGLHKPDWLVETFRDMRDDLEDAQAQGKRLLLMFEQRGCIYCTRMHENVYPDPEITRMLTEDFMVVQINLFGNIPVTDFDGTTMDERDMARRWGVVFTPTLVFAPETAPESGSMRDAAVMTMPGAFERGTTRLMLQWVLEKGYEGEEHFQHYVARMLQERSD